MSKTQGRSQILRHRLYALGAAQTAAPLRSETGLVRTWKGWKFYSQTFQLPGATLSKTSPEDETAGFALARLRHPEGAQPSGD